ncbi:MAG: beta strand repeat-containing protein, partial [Ilumatobacteraceae bacterium]
MKVAPNTTIILPGLSLSLDGEHVVIGGTIDVSGARAGSLTIEASEVVFESTSRMYANGDVGGGNIFVGGEWQGAGGLRPAHRIEIASGARIEASAREEGSGGTVVFWADPSNATAVVDARGHITARGGRRFGDGGRIETSAPRLNVDEIRVDTSPSSTIGRSGTWLIDPRDITISTLTSSNATGVSPFTSTVESGLTPANIQASTIVEALATGNVTVSTAGDGSMSGDITVSAEISAGGANKLTLLADGDIILSARIRRTSTGSVDLTATSGVVRGSGNLALSGGTVTLTQGGTNTSGAFYTGAITGTGTSVVKLGSGTLVVSGASNFTGSTTISEGTLKLGAMDKWADDSAVSIASGATLDLNDFDDTVGSISGAGSITLGTGTLTAGGNNESTTYSGIMSGAGGRFTKQGDGVLTLSGANTYTGVTTISAGTIQLGAADRISNSSGLDIIDGATFDLNNFNETIASLSNTLGTGYVNLGSATLTIGGSTSTEFLGVISGTGGLTHSSSGILTLSGANTYTGSTAVTSGTITLGASNALSNSTAVSVSAGATLNLAGNSDEVGSITGIGTISLGAGTLTSGSAGSTTFSGTITGTGGITKTGASTTLTLSTSGSYSGATSVSAGTLAVTHASALGTADGATTVSDGATLAISNGITLAEPLTLYGTGNSANGAIRSTSGNNTISELVTLASAAEVQTDAGSLTFDVGTGNAFTGTFGLTFDAASGVTVTVADPIATSTGTVTKSGLGSLTLSATNTFSGATTISAGTLTVSGSGSLSSGSYGGAITNDGSFVYASSTSQTLSGAISGTGTITKNTSSASRLTLSTSNSYSGSTTVSTGFLAISHANALGATSGATTVANNATLELSGNISSAEPITISGDGVTVSSAEVGAIRSTSGVNTLTGLVT